MRIFYDHENMRVFFTEIRVFWVESFTCIFHEFLPFLMSHFRFIVVFLCVACNIIQKIKIEVQTFWIVSIIWEMKLTFLMFFQHQNIINQLELKFKLWTIHFLTHQLCVFIKIIHKSCCSELSILKIWD